MVPYNEPSLNFHHKMGFVDVERVEHSPDYAVMYLEKWLVKKPAETRCDYCDCLLRGKDMIKAHNGSEEHRKRVSLKQRLYKDSGKESVKEPKEQVKKEPVK